VLGRYDVVVVGGGTGGAPAGIAAAREGARVLVVEFHHMLGGVGTAGQITGYYHGLKVGFTATVPGSPRWAVEQKAQWWRQTLLDAGADIWFGTIGCGAVVQDDRVVGVVVATPHGRGVVLADVVIDSTSNRTSPLRRAPRPITRAAASSRPWAREPPSGGSAAAARIPRSP
jgi:flavin-dependent dehydrogenase